MDGHLTTLANSDSSVAFVRPIPSCRNPLLLQGVLVLGILSSRSLLLSMEHDRLLDSNLLSLVCWSGYFFITGAAGVTSLAGAGV